MKQKTAMMELIEALEKHRDYVLPCESALDKAYESSLSIAIKEAQQLLEKEKEQIVDAITESEKEHYVNAEVYPPQFVVDKANTYYNQTYLEEEQQ